MLKTRELSESIRNAIIPKYKVSKGHTAISKELGIPVSTVHNVIKTFAKHATVKNLPGCEGRGKLIREFFEVWCELWKKHHVKRPKSGRLTWNNLKLWFQHVPYAAQEGLYVAKEDGTAVKNI